MTPAERLLEIIDAYEAEAVAREWKPDMCLCGHPTGDHRSAGTGWPHPPRFGGCRVLGCDCREFASEA